MNQPGVRPIARRGEVWLVTPDTIVGAEIMKQRPMVVVRRNLNPERGLTTIVVPFTGAEGKQPGFIRPLIKGGRGSGLTKDSLALCEQVRCVDRVRLLTKTGELDTQDFSLVLRGLYEILDFDGDY